jgi:competence protein ComEC
VTISITALVSWAIVAIWVSNEGITPWILIGLGSVGIVLGFNLPENKRSLLALLSSVLILAGVSIQIQTELTKPASVLELTNQNVTADVVVELLNPARVIYENFSGDSVFGVAVKLISLEGKTAYGRGFLIHEGETFARGDKVQLRGAFSEPGRNLRDSFLIKSVGEIILIEAASGRNDFFNKLRSDFSNQLWGITPDAKVLVSGLAIGEISDLSQELEEKMRVVSLTHLVAVSGSNCAIVVGLVYLIASRLRFGRVGRTLISLTALLLYVLLVGPDPSVLRASVMTASVILMLALGRRTFAVNALAFAVIVLVVADPWLAVEFGFGLSVLATAGILILAPAMAEKFSSRMPKLFALALAVTISAQILCLPLLMQLQPGLASYSVIANLLAGPMVAPVTILGMLGVIATLFAPWLVGPISYLASLGSFWIESVALFFADLPVAYFPWVTGIPAAVVSVFLILASVAYFRAKEVAVRQLGTGVLVVIITGTLTVPAFGSALPKAWPPSSWNIVACDVGQGDAVVLRSGSAIALIDVGPEDVAIDKCLIDLSIRRIDLLVLTHFDFDHVGAIAGALKRRKVETALISGFPDQRPATKQALDLLKASGTRVIVAETGQTGKLGEFAWDVLAPSKTASEAKDSNDASVVMSFRSSSLEVLLLGDLGEPGQLRIIEQAKKLHGSSQVPLVLKVSHHGSNDQSEQFHRELPITLALISVGESNGYGHPGARMLELVQDSVVLRTDMLGSIAISGSKEKLSWSSFRG